MFITIKKNSLVLGAIGMAVIALLALTVLSINTHAAEFESGDTVTIDSVTENLYVAGSIVTVESNVRKDLVVAGSQVTVEGSVERNLNAAGGQVTIESDQILGTARVIAGEVTLSDVTIQEDLIIFGGEVTLEDVTIAGDLVSYTGSLTVNDSSIRGDALVSFSEYSGDTLEDIVEGELDIQEGEATVEREVSAGERVIGVLGYALRGEISVIVATLFFVWFLGKRNRLGISTISFNTRFFLDFLIGLALVVLPVIIFIISGLVAIIPFIGVISFFNVVGVVTAMIYLFVILSSLFSVIYMANLFRNSFKLTLSARNMVLITLLVWFILSLLGYIPIIGWLFPLALGLIGLANVGFLVRTLNQAIDNYLKSRDKEYIPTK
jgi:hypothetical protein